MGDNGDFLHRFGILLLIGHHGVTHLVVGHQLFLKFGENAALFLRAGNDQLESRQHVLLGHQLAPLADGPQGRLVHQVGKVRTHAPGGGQGHLLQVHILGQLDVSGMDLERGDPPRQVGPVNGDPAVEPPRPQQGLVQHLRAVCGRQKDHALGGIEAVHLRQELV